MVAGRADAGSQPEAHELTRWETLPIIDPGGWLEARTALRESYRQPNKPRAEQMVFAARAVMDRVEALGRAAWAD